MRDHYADANGDGTGYPINDPNDDRDAVPDAPRTEARDSRPVATETLTEALYRELDHLLVDAHGVPEDERIEWSKRLARIAREALTRSDQPLTPEYAAARAELVERVLSQPTQSDLSVAWERAEKALGPRQRLVMFQDHEGPVYVQVLASVGDDDEGMVPVLTELAAYPSKGLGSIVDGLNTITRRLSKEGDTDV